MAEHIESKEFSRLAQKVREIAEGIFDEAERELVLRFVSTCEAKFAHPHQPG